MAGSPSSQELEKRAGMLMIAGLAYARQGNLSEATAHFERVIAIQPGNYSAHFNLGLSYDKSGQLSRAAEQFRMMTLRFVDPELQTRALNQWARMLEGLGRYAQAEATLRRSLEINPDQPDALQDLGHVRQAGCIWPVTAPFAAVSSKMLVAAMEPLALAAHTDDPELQLALNSQYAARAAAEGEPYPDLDIGSENPGRLRIGYLSADFRDHATSYLMRNVPGLHDRAKVEVYSYYCGPATDDALHNHFRAQSDRFVDIHGMNDEEARRRMIDDGIHILVDLNVHTRYRRPGLVALNPAPIIVNWLGFPGTAGTAHHHYIIADDWTIPPENERYFSEKVLRLACYQPNPAQRAVTDAPTSREMAGLPRDAFVYCCFNGARKITPGSFSRWMRILQAVEGSVLWLLASTSEIEDRLRDEARSSGIDPSRLVFAAWKPNADHLARYPLADLFVDTEPYGAHTTSSDALWMGLPVVTLSGRSFASRVCGSLVRQAGLPELVFTDAEAFEHEAIALSGDPERLAALRRRLAATRGSSALFDPAALVRRLEDLYEEMWGDYVRGELPRPCAPNLKNASIAR